MEEYLTVLAVVLDGKLQIQKQVVGLFYYTYVRLSFEQASKNRTGFFTGVTAKRRKGPYKFSYRHRLQPHFPGTPDGRKE